MSKIDDLTKEKCPNGVEYKNILDVISMKARVGWQALTKKEYLQTGEYYLITGTDFKENGSIGFDSCVYVSKDRFDMDENIKVHANDILMTKDGTLGKVAFMETEPPKPATLNGGVYRLTVISEEVLPRYMYHYFTSYEFKCFVDKVKTGGTIKHLTQKWFETLEVPVPPIEVQEEIIRILDRFVELDTGLQAELEARKKQYEYYKMKLLSFGDKVPVKELKKTCNMKAGKAISASNISETKNKVQKYACFGGNGVRGYVKFQSHKGNYPIIGRQGALCGNVNYATGVFYATEHAVVVTSLGEYTQRFLYYLLAAMNLNQYKSQGAQPGLAVGNIEKLLAPVPTIEEQERITTILDTFEMICSDYSHGLPAEIEACHKQYEYYRDKLLTFKRKVV